MVLTVKSFHASSSVHDGHRPKWNRFSSWNAHRHDELSSTWKPALKTWRPKHRVAGEVEAAGVSRDQNTASRKSRDRLWQTWRPTFSARSSSDRRSTPQVAADPSRDELSSAWRLLFNVRWQGGNTPAEAPGVKLSPPAWRRPLSARRRAFSADSRGFQDLKPRDRARSRSFGDVTASDDVTARLADDGGAVRDFVRSVPPFQFVVARRRASGGKYHWQVGPWSTHHAANNDDDENIGKSQIGRVSYISIYLCYFCFR